MCGIDPCKLVMYVFVHEVYVSACTDKNLVQYFLNANRTLG